MTGLFEPTRGAKVRCTVCGVTGYPGGPWTAKHATHDHQCACGRRFANRQAIACHHRWGCPSREEVTR